MNFENFATAVYPFVELQPFHRSYYRLLQAFAEGKVRKLLITMPPQHGKSLGASTLLPAYMLGLNPDLRIAIASYSASLASKFNRRVQRILESDEYAELFPETTIKKSGRSSSYIRTAEEVEIIGHHGSLISVGREGSLTGNRVDCFILDDLYKDAMEANSPVVRENCREWYTSVVRTRMHNASQEIMVFTRWHEQDLIGTIRNCERVVDLKQWEELGDVDGDTWVALNFEALKVSESTEIDPRDVGQSLWEQRHSAALLASKRRLDPQKFECLYQGNPSTREGLLYGDGFATYTTLPKEIVRYANYTDTADMGDDYLCSVCYAVDSDGVIYVTDVVYSREPMEVTEKLVSQMLNHSATRVATIESNNGGRGFARVLQRLCPDVRVEWFHQSDNKEARILSNSATVMHSIRMPEGWNRRWNEFYNHIVTYRRMFSSNRWHDAADVLTGIVENSSGSRVRRVKFLR